MNYKNYQMHFGRITKRTVSLLLTVLFLFTYISPGIVVAEDTDQLSQREKVSLSLKVEKILSEENKGKHTNKGTTIEILEVNSIKGGVEVLARAWEKGKQIGFGPDGSVDIERFNIYNPPILVPDTNGDIKRSSIDPETLEMVTHSYREDPKSALIETLFNIISVKKEKFTNSAITPNKIGNTTSTFYSEADPATTAGDGTWHVVMNPTTWATIRSLSSTTVDNAGTILYLRTEKIVSGDYRFGRAYINFDTSPIGSTASVTSATLNITAAVNTTSLGQEASVGMVQFFGSAPTAIADDFDQVGSLNAATEGAPRINTLRLQNAGTIHGFTFNSTGLGWVNKTGVTKLGLRNAKDLDNNAGAAGNNSGRPQFYSSDVTGTTNDPNLVVEHVTNTTVRIYSQASDGYVSNSYCNEIGAWSSVRNASTSSNVCDTQEYIKVRSDSADDAYQIYRGSLVFDTSVIPDNATVTAATVGLHGTNSNGYNNSGIVLTSHVRSTSTLASADWQLSSFGLTAMGSTTNQLATSSYNSITLNNNGVSHVSNVGFTTFGILTINDFSNSDPGASRKEATFISANQSGTSSDPYIEITYIQ